jgi:hypothetical protein
MSDATSWHIDFTEPWTITALTLLGLLFISTTVRVYRVCYQNRRRTVYVPPVRKVTRDVEKADTRSQKKNYESRAQMRL